MVLPSSLSSRIERSVYNRRRRKLFFIKKRIRKAMSDKLTGTENYFIVDSMPLETCKLSHSPGTTICKEDYLTNPSKGYCAGRKLHFYGHKLHAVSSVSGVFPNFKLTQAAVRDIQYLKNVKTTLTSCVLTGDKGYLSADYPLDLSISNHIILPIDFIKLPLIVRTFEKRYYICK